MLKTYQDGRGPVLMNCGDTPDDDMAYMRWALMNEGNVTLLNYLDKKGIDPKHYLVEFNAYEPEVRAGINIDTRAATSVSGLFAAGDTIGNIKRGVSPGAFTMGWIAGESAAAFSKTAQSIDPASASHFLEEKERLLNDFMEREEGASWKEALAACQDTMNWYGNGVRYETLLKAGLAHMQSIKEEALRSLKARNLHELMHCLSALNLMDVGLSSMLCALERKETRLTLRESFARVDYPDEDPEMNKILVLKLEEGRPKLHWREPRPIG
jgi:succinate dehydrogenase/fumarate reductase flavoprotein subunit